MKKRGGGKKENLELLNQSGSGKFTFENGDVYDGGYIFNQAKNLLVKDGPGIYTTDNFDIYEGEWVNDVFGNSDFHIKYNNDAQFRGKIESNGNMSGPGTYTFPDGSSIEAIWVDNVPTVNIIYREPQGFSWMVKDISQDRVTFFSGNHFWDDMLSAESTTNSMESFEQ